MSDKPPQHQHGKYNERDKDQYASDSTIPPTHNQDYFQSSSNLDDPDGLSSSLQDDHHLQATFGDEYQSHVIHPHIDKSSIDYEIEASYPIGEDYQPIDQTDEHISQPIRSSSTSQSTSQNTSQSYSYSQHGSFANFEDVDFDMDMELEYLEQQQQAMGDQYPPGPSGYDGPPDGYPDDYPFFDDFDIPSSSSTTTTTTATPPTSVGDTFQTPLKRPLDKTYPGKGRRGKHSNDGEEDELDPDMVAYLTGRPRNSHPAADSAGMDTPISPKPTKRVRISLGPSSSLISGGPSTAKPSTRGSDIKKKDHATTPVKTKPLSVNKKDLHTTHRPLHSFILPAFQPGTGHIVKPPSITPRENIEPDLFKSELAFRHAEHLLGISSQDYDVVDTDLHPYKEYLLEPQVFTEERGWGNFLSVGSGRNTRYLLVESASQKNLRLRAKAGLISSALNTIGNDNSILTRKSKQLEEIALHQQRLEAERLQIEHENQLAEQALRMKGSLAKQLQSSVNPSAALEAATAAAAKPPSKHMTYQPTPVKGAGKRTPKHLKKQRSGLLFVDKYAPFNYASLLSPEYVNREAIHWLVQWNGVVFQKNAVVLTARQKQFERNMLMNQQQDKREGGHSPPEPVKKTFLSWNDPQSVQKYGPHKKILLIHGPPGCGKTTLAHIIAKQCGYRVSEINASDDRGGEAARNKITNALENQSLHGSSVPTCLILDEIDGASGGDGSFEESAPSSVIDLLVKVAKEATLYDQSSFQLEQDQLDTTMDGDESYKTSDDPKKARQPKGKQLIRPIICICNNIQAPALRPLLHYAKILQLQSIDRLRLVNRLKAIAYRENIRYESRFLATLADRLANDIRSCLHALQFMSVKSKRSKPAISSSLSSSSSSTSTPSIYSTPVKPVKTKSRIHPPHHNNNDNDSSDESDGDSDDSDDDTEHILRVSDLSRMRIGQNDTTASITMLTDLILGLKAPSTVSTSSMSGVKPSNASIAKSPFLPPDLSSYHDSNTDLLSVLADNSATGRVMEQIYAMYPSLTGVTSNMTLIAQIIEVISTFYHNSYLSGELGAIYPFIIAPFLISTISLVRYNSLQRDLPSTRIPAMTNLHVITRCNTAYAHTSLVMYRRRDMVMHILPFVSMVLSPHDIVSQSWKGLTPTEMQIFHHIIQFMSYFKLKYQFQSVANVPGVRNIPRQQQLQQKGGHRQPSTQLLLDPNIDAVVHYDLHWCNDDPLSTQPSRGSSMIPDSLTKMVTSHVNNRVLFIREPPKPLPFAIKEALTREVEIYIFKQQMQKDNEIRQRLKKQNMNSMDQMMNDGGDGASSSSSNHSSTRKSKYMTEEDAVEQMAKVTEKYIKMASATMAESNAVSAHQQQQMKSKASKHIGSLRGFLKPLPSAKAARQTPVDSEPGDENNDEQQQQKQQTSLEDGDGDDSHANSENTSSHGQPIRQDVSGSRAEHTLQLLFFEGFSNAVKKPVSMDLFL